MPEKFIISHPKGNRAVPADLAGKTVTTSREDRIVVRWKDDGGDDSVVLERV